MNFDYLRFDLYFHLISVLLRKLCLFLLEGFLFLFVIIVYNNQLNRLILLYLYYNKSFVIISNPKTGEILLLNVAFPSESTSHDSCWKSGLLRLTFLLSPGP